MIEKLARACFARLCPWIAKEYPDFPVEKSTTMQAFVEGASCMKLGHRLYSYKHTSRVTIYVTINGHQVGHGYSTMREINLAHEYWLTGRVPPGTFSFKELYGHE